MFVQLTLNQTEGSKSHRPYVVTVGEVLAYDIFPGSRTSSHELHVVATSRAYYNEQMMVHLP